MSNNTSNAGTSSANEQFSLPECGNVDLNKTDLETEDTRVFAFQLPPAEEQPATGDGFDNPVPGIRITFPNKQFERSTLVQLFRVDPAGNTIHVTTRWQDPDPAGAQNSTLDLLLKDQFREGEDYLLELRNRVGGQGLIVVANICGNLFEEEGFDDRAAVFVPGIFERRDLEELVRRLFGS